MKDCRPNRAYYPRNTPRDESFIIKPRGGFQRYPKTSELPRLINVLENAIHIAFENHPASSPLQKEKAKLLKDVASFATTESKWARLGYNMEDVIGSRQEPITELIYILFNLLESFHSRIQPGINGNARLAQDIKWLRTERKIFSKGLATSLRPGLARDEDFNILLSNARTPEQTITLNMRHINEVFHKAFDISYATKPSNSSSADTNVSITQELKWELRSLSEDAQKAFLETDALLNEVKGLGKISTEDEYFIEQVTASYYPAILSAVKTVRAREASQKAALGEEILKQLNSIQLGLHHIEDRVVQQGISAVKAQTEFLESKVLGNHTLTLNEQNTGKTVAESLAEAKAAKELRAEDVAPAKDEKDVRVTEKVTISGNMNPVLAVLELERAKEQVESVSDTIHLFNQYLSKLNTF